MNRKFSVLFLIAIALLFVLGGYFVFTNSWNIKSKLTALPFLSSQQPQSPLDSEQIVHRNEQYGFTFALPQTWRNYSIHTSEWEGRGLEGEQEGIVVEQGPLISIQHPSHTSQQPRQDIPIMVFTQEQWNLLQQGEFHIGAAPFNPSELGRNSRYVFALPARYNYAFPTGFEEVEEILQNNPLHGIENFDQ